MYLIQSAFAVVPSSILVSSSVNSTILLSFIILHVFLPHFGRSIIKLHPVLNQWPISKCTYRSICIILPNRKIESHLISMISPILWENFHFINISIAHLEFNYLFLGSEAIANNLPILFPLPMHLQALPRPRHRRNPLLKVLMPLHLRPEVRTPQKQIIILLVDPCQPTATGLYIFDLPQRSFPSVHGDYPLII